MADYSTTTHGPAATAPSVTNLVAKCAVCGCQWQVRSPNRDDARACGFCGAPESAISIISERPDYSQGRTRA